jgi:hypothetical protein
MHNNALLFVSCLHIPEGLVGMDGWILLHCLRVEWMEALVYCGSDENLLVNNIHMCKLYEPHASRLVFYPDFYMCFMPLQRICYATSIFYIHISFQFILYTPPILCPICSNPYFPLHQFSSPSAHHHLVHP